MHLLGAAMFHREIFEYAPNLVKKTITGNGHAEKEQVRIALKYQLTGCPEKLKDDESDALGVAITHASIRRLIK
jgi:crossover junction endodeoxyribonuclease RuvC